MRLGLKLYLCHCFPRDYPIGYSIASCTLSQALSTSSLKVKSIALKMGSNCSALVAPMMVEATKSNCFDHAVASVTGCMPACLAISTYLAVDANVLSLRKRVAMARCLALDEFM